MYKSTKLNLVILCQGSKKLADGKNKAALQVKNFSRDTLSLAPINGKG